VHAAQNQADHVHNRHNHTQDDHNSQGIGLGLLPVIAGNNRVQQVVDTAAMNLAYVKLHNAFLAQTAPSKNGVNRHIFNSSGSRRLILPLTTPRSVLRLR
jgi:hypothetical protein